MKKIISLFLAMTLVLALFCNCAAANNSTEEQFTPEHYKIGVFVTSWNQNMMMMKEYYDNYLAKEFDCSFIYSDGTSTDVGAMISFIENCATMGVQAIINYNPFPAEQAMSVSAKCEEYNIWYVLNDAAVISELDQFSTFVGVGGALPGTVADQFYEMAEKVLGDETHNVVLHSGLCLFGLEQHIQTAIAIVKILEEKYGIEFTGYADERELVTKCVAQTEFTSADGNVKFLLDPTSITSLTPDLYYNILKDGTYDTVIFTGPLYSMVETAIVDAEKETGKNIHLISIAPIAEPTHTSFATLDNSGNQSLDCALIKNTTSAGILFAMVYNALTGHAKDMRIDGACQLYDAPMWTCYTLDEYEKIALLDTKDTGYYSYTADDIKEMLFVYNSNLDAAGMQKLAGAKADLNAVFASNGIS